MSITYHVCKYTPTELLTALGGQCALLDEAPENFDLSDQVAHPNLCGFGKSVIQAALAGQVKELVLVNCCDTIRSAYDILKEFGNLDFLYLLDILHSQEGCSVQHARDQLLALAEAYGAYKGTQFDRAAFFAAFQSPPPVTGPHIAVLGAKMGSHLFSLVEETMPLPVENATCANNRRVAPPADQGLRRPHGGLRPLSAGPAALHAHDRQHRPPGPVQHPRPGGGGLPHPAILRLLRL